jgi:hypothetical protein
MTSLNAARDVLRAACKGLNEALAAKGYTTTLEIWVSRHNSDDTTIYVSNPPPNSYNLPRHLDDLDAMVEIWRAAIDALPLADCKAYAEEFSGPLVGPPA